MLDLGPCFVQKYATITRCPQEFAELGFYLGRSSKIKIFHKQYNVCSIPVHFLLAKGNGGAIDQCPQPQKEYLMALVWGRI